MQSPFLRNFGRALCATKRAQNNAQSVSLLLSSAKGWGCAAQRVRHAAQRGWVVGAQRPNNHANTRTHLHTNVHCASQRFNTTPSRCAALCKQSSHAHASLPIRLGNTLPSYTEHPAQHPAQRGACLVSCAAQSIVSLNRVWVLQPR